MLKRTAMLIALLIVALNAQSHSDSPLFSLQVNESLLRLHTGRTVTDCARLCSIVLEIRDV